MISEGVRTASADVVVAGAGIGGISAAIAAARAGARTLLLEAGPEIGGTGVHSPVGLVCTFFDAEGRPINRGLHAEFLPYLYEPGAWRRCQTYDERELLDTYRRLVAAESRLTVVTGARVTSVARDVRSLLAAETTAGRFEGAVFVDGTAGGELAARAGAPCEFGRPGDGRRQPCTLTFRVGPVDFSAFGLDVRDPDWLRWENVTTIWRQLEPAYRRMKEAGGTRNPREDVLCFPDRFGRSLLFNQTRVADVDATDPGSLAEGYEEGRRQAREFWGAIRTHPAFARVTDIELSPMLGVRESRRVLGDHMLSEEECLAEARFPDMVAACGYALDIHDPAGTGGTRMARIPGSGYYHIPYRCLTARGLDNLLVGSRCISGTHEAHSSYRVMAPVSAIGQAAGVAAALAARHSGGAVRGVRAEWIRIVLAASGQFTEGSLEAPPATEAARAGETPTRVAAVLIR